MKRRRKAAGGRYHSRRSRDERGVLIVVIIDALLPDAAPDQIITLASRVVLTVVSSSNYRVWRDFSRECLDTPFETITMSENESYLLCACSLGHFISAASSPICASVV